MTYHKDVHLTCDGFEDEQGNYDDDCEGHYGLQVTILTAADAREAAHENGWVTRGAEDFCPHCK